MEWTVCSTAARATQRPTRARNQSRPVLIGLTLNAWEVLNASCEVLQESKSPCMCSLEHLPLPDSTHLVPAKSKRERGGTPYFLELIEIAPCKYLVSTSRL